MADFSSPVDKARIYLKHNQFDLSIISAANTLKTIKLKGENKANNIIGLLAIPLERERLLEVFEL